MRAPGPRARLMMSAMPRLAFLALTAALVAAAVTPSRADQKAFLGRWNLTGTGPDSSAVYWLEVKEEGGQLSGMFLNRGGSPVKLASIEVKGDELVFTTAAPEGRTGQTFRATRKGSGLEGSTTAGDKTIAFTGVHPPAWKAANANATHTYGKPVDAGRRQVARHWGVQVPSRPSGWSVVDGAMTNEKGANNLVSKQTFKDFKIQAEYKIEPGSNSGIYLRGRYELQVLDDFGKPPETHGHMAIYAWVAPSVNASKPATEWQVMEAVIVGNKVTVTFNGQKVHDNATIQAITGGALDANETQPGPIMLQGDHGKVWYRKVTVTPIVKAGTQAHASRGDRLVQSGDGVGDAGRRCRTVAADFRGPDGAARDAPGRMRTRTGGVGTERRGPCEIRVLVRAAGAVESLDRRHAADPERRSREDVRAAADSGCAARRADRGSHRSHPGREHVGIRRLLPPGRRARGGLCAAVRRSPRVDAIVAAPEGRRHRPGLCADHARPPRDAGRGRPRSVFLGHRGTRPISAGSPRLSRASTSSRRAAARPAAPGDRAAASGRCDPSRRSRRRWRTLRSPIDRTGSAA